MKLRTIEATRGVAALSVVVAHLSSTLATHPEIGGNPFGGAVLPGAPAVECFFVLSGFVMALAHGDRFGRPARLPGFVWSRICRIYPMMWVALALAALELGRGVAFPTAWWIDWATLNPSRTADVLPVAWTLKLEMGFYVLLSLAMLPWIGWLVIPLWALASPVFLLTGLAPSLLPAELMLHPFVGQLLTFSPDFLAGLAAGAILRWKPPGRRLAMALLAAGVPLVLVRLPFDRWGAEYGGLEARYVYGTGYALFLLGVGALERLRRLRLGGWAAVLGAASYPVYLVHLTVMDFWRKTLTGPDVPPYGQGTAFALLSLAGVVGLGLVLGAGIDPPLQRGLRRLGQWLARLPARPGGWRQAAPTSRSIQPPPSETSPA